MIEMLSIHQHYFRKLVWGGGGGGQDGGGLKL